MTCGYSPSGRYIASGGLDNTVTVHNIAAAEGGEIPEIQKELIGHEGFVSCVRFIDDNQVMSSSGDHTNVLWDINEGTKVQTFVGHKSDVMCIALSEDKNTFLSGSCDEMSLYFDIRAGPDPVMSFTGHTSDVNAISWFPTGNAFASGSDDGTARLTDLRVDRDFNIYSLQEPERITTLDFSASGQYLFTGSGTACLAWDTLTTYITQAIEHPEKVSYISVSPDGMALCTGCWDSSLRVYI
eukprot:TRINITY_DN1192_c0_g1_i1.p1 TRINITY_DN1192_c0_g1~~TRINITY_DN1192_c0_g1_i1.p1  ORF type:complete len:241 (-),score=59.02 TRINITY_DN1192_c0_g1_i1:83-805(-)